MSNPIDETRTERLHRLFAASGLLLFLVTWRLWIPQTRFPQVPLFDIAARVPPAVDWGLAAGILLSLVLVLCSSARSRWRIAGLVLFLISTTAAIVFDQHRAQPWAYQFLLIALVLLVRPRPGVLFWLQALTISIYAHSGISKLDYSFCTGLGQVFVEQLFAFVQVPVANWSQTLRCVAALAFPVGELVVALGLCVPRRRWRWTFLALAIAMHLGLLLVLGPWGLRHSWGVLIWNVFFIAQDWLLFAPRKISAETAADGNSANPPGDVTAEGETLTAGNPPAGRWRKGRERVAIGVLVAAIVLPVLEPWGLFDHWPAWGLYSARTERVHLILAPRARNRLPARWQFFIIADPRDRPWLRMRLDRWSLAELAVPLYPQGRFQLGVARAVIERGGVQDHQFRIILESAANRWTGAREQVELTTREEIDAIARTYWFGTRPRR